MTRIPTLLETVRVRGGRAPLWHLHLRRLATSCRQLGVPFPPRLEVPSEGADRVHRLEVGPGGSSVSEREVGPDRPIRLATSSVPHPRYPHKTTDRGPFVRATEAARAAGADEALLLAPEGYVAEAGIWCLYWWEGDALAAPALDLGILPGVSRARIEELVGELRPRRVRPPALAGRPLLLSNAVRGIVEVSSLDGVTMPSDPRTSALAARFWP